MSISSELSPIKFTPSVFNFGDIPITNRPQTLTSTITNTSNKIVVLDFDSIVNELYWFHYANSIIDEQRNSGFDIFAYSEQLDQLTIQPHESIKVHCSIIPLKCHSQNLIVKAKIPYIFDDKTSQGEKEKFECEITITANITNPSFKLNPKILFLDDCSVNTPQTSKFSIKNTSPFLLSIIIYSPPFIEISTPQFPNFVKIQPDETIDLSLTHTPQEVGQFDHKIVFDCIESTNLPKILHLMTSVSPVDVPVNFPTITIDSKKALNFGEIHSCQLSEKSFTITNDSETSYDVLVAGIIDIFSPIISEDDQTIGLTSESLATINNDTPNDSLASISSAQGSQAIPKQESYKSRVLNEQMKIGSSKELKFKTLLSAQYESKLQISIQPHSTVTVFIGYTPALNTMINSEVFDPREFMVTLVFSGTEVYYRHIKCRALVCNSEIKIEPSIIHFGDTIVGTSNKTGTVQITNVSPLKTMVKIQSSVKSLVIAPNRVEVPARTTIAYTFSFYPKKVSPEFSGAITFTNIKNANNEVQLVVEAAVIATASESQHSISYSLSSAGRHVTHLDFSFVPQNFIAARTFILKNKMKETLQIKFTSNSPDELFLYSDDNTNQHFMQKSTSASSMDQMGSKNVNQQTDDDQIKNYTHTSNSADMNTALLSQDSPLRSIGDLAEYTRRFSNFYENQYLVYSNYTDKQIIDHFDTIATQFQENLKNPSIHNYNNVVIHLQPLTKMEFVAVLIPKGDQSYIWKRKQLEFSIELISCTSSKPRSFPVVYNTAESMSFLSSNSLNFGTIQTNTHSQYSLNLLNESSVPLLFKLTLSSKAPISFDEKNCGIICPFSSLTIPFSYSPKIDGKWKSSIIIHNILNSKEERSVALKGKVVRRSNFVIDPTEIDFGEITSGSSSNKFLLFITNTSSSNNQFTFSNVQKDLFLNQVQPIICYQFKDIKPRLLTEKVKLQIEKLSNKLRILTRKKKWAYAEQIKKVIDELSNTAVESTSMQIKQLGEKYMNRVVVKADPLQMQCIEVQMIPTIVSKKPLKTAEDVEGIIMIYEQGRVDSRKSVKYKARVIPQNRLQVFDSVSRKPLQIEPNQIKIDHIYIQEMGRTTLKIKNIEGTEENFWILSNSSDNAIITAQTTEGKLKPGETIEIPIDIYCSNTGMITKTITVASQTCWKEIPITFNAEYRPVLQISTSKIDFGQIQLISLQTVEKRRSMTITNMLDSSLYIVVTHNIPFLYIYENDPEELQFRPLRIGKNSSITINLNFHPQLEIEMYHKYKTIVIDSFLEIKAYDTEEEAELSSNESSSTLPYYKTTVPVFGRIGRVGLRSSLKVVDFGSLSNQDSVETTISIKNRSSRLAMEVIASPTQGITIDPSNFTIKGHQEQEITVRYHPSSWGLNEGSILFASTLTPPSTYQKKINVVSFVDPKIIEVDQDSEHKNITKIDLGKLYLQSDGIPVPKKITMNIRNVSRHAVWVFIPDIDKKYSIYPKSEVSIGFSFPFKTTSILNVAMVTNSSSTISFSKPEYSNETVTEGSNKQFSIASSLSSMDSVNTAANAALAVSQNLIGPNTQNQSPSTINDNVESLNNRSVIVEDTPPPQSQSTSLFVKPEDTAFWFILPMMSAATKKYIKTIKIKGEFVVSIASISVDSISLGCFGSFNNWSIESNSVIIRNHSNIDLVMNLYSSTSTYFDYSSSNTSNFCFKVPKQIGPIPPLTDYQFKIEPIIENMRNLNEGAQNTVIFFTNTNNHDNRFKLSINYDIRDSFIQIDRAQRDPLNKYEFSVHLNKFTEIVTYQRDAHLQVNNQIDEFNDDITRIVATCWFTMTNLLEKEITVEVTAQVEETVSKFIEIELFQRKTKIKLTSFVIQSNESFEIRVKAIKTMKRKWKGENDILFAKLNFKIENSPDFLVNVFYSPKMENQ